MTTESTRPDLWGEEREWEGQYGPGELLDQWREACATLEKLAELTEGRRHEMTYIAIMDALKRARVEAEHFEGEIRMRLSWNKAHGKLTPFGRVLSPLMERAGYGSAAELLLAAGKMEEPHATEKLERLMHGPNPTGDSLAGYLTGFSEALGLPEGEEGDKHRMRLSSTLLYFVGRDHAEKMADEAEAEYASSPQPEPGRDAEILHGANANLTGALEALEGLSAEAHATDAMCRAVQAVCEAGQIVSAEQRRRQGGGR